MSPPVERAELALALPAQTAQARRPYQFRTLPFFPPRGQRLIYDFGFAIEVTHDAPRVTFPVSRRLTSATTFVSPPSPPARRRGLGRGG
jgi:hypothetical protein